MTKISELDDLKAVSTLKQRIRANIAGQADGSAAEVDPSAGPGFWCAAKDCGAIFAIVENDHFHVDLGKDRYDTKYGNELRGCDCEL